MEENKVYRHTFEGGVNSDIADELIDNKTSRRLVNIDVFSSDGNMYIATGVLGNTKIINENLPEGRNKVVCRPVKDEENNKMYFLVWNSEGFHTWFEYDYATDSITVLFQNINDSGNVDILKLKEDDFLVHSDIVDNKLLYWAMKGHPARKMNLLKIKDKSENGYGEIVGDHTIRAYKRTATFAPQVRYSTDTTRNFNNVFGNLFRFATRYVYDDGEKSHFSDFSKVAIPPEEDARGTVGVPLDNNVILVNMSTGDHTVKRIDLIMQKTNNIDGGVLNWVLIASFDKETLGISDDSNYEYSFYNNDAYLSIDPNEVIIPYSDLPINPECQFFAGNAMVYSNFYSGFNPVPIDVDAVVEYNDLYIDSSSTPVFNDPVIIANRTNMGWVKSHWWGGSGYRWSEGTVTIGPDVKRGNTFTLFLKYWVKREVLGVGGYTEVVEIKSKVATLEDTALTIANDIANRLRSTSYANGSIGTFVGTAVGDPSGNAVFNFRVVAPRGEEYIYFETDALRVEYASLVDAGSSVLNRKLGSVHRAYIVYEDEDGRKSLGYPVGKDISIKNLNELGEIKNPVVSYVINHLPPTGAKSYQITETMDLVHQDYIQILIQGKIKSVETNTGNVFHDLIIGSLPTYNRMYPNSTLRYEFKAGDRVRLLREYNNGTWTVPADVLEYEVIGYYETVTETVNSNIRTTGTNRVETSAPDSNNIGSYISIDGYMREIVDVYSDDGIGYELSSPIFLSENQEPVTRPSYQIINNRGVLRIKENPLYPINANGSQLIYSLVQVYKPYRDFSGSENEISYSIGEKYDILEVNGIKYHQGNIQDQTLSQPAIVRTSGVGTYVRNRELPISNSEKQPQVVMSQIEDRSYSDFYYSDFPSYGRPTVPDTGRGRVHLDSSSIFSNNFISGTDVNGLSMFIPSNRRDYNDHYGAIKVTMFNEGRAYIFKSLKVGFIPIRANILSSTDQSVQVVGYSTDLLPNKMEYFIWEGGIGDEIDGVIRDGNDVYYISPNSGVWARIGYSGTEPISEQRFLDKDIRELLSSASRSGARAHMSFDRAKNNVVLTVDPYKEVYFNDPLYQSNVSLVEIPSIGDWEVVQYPNNGTVSIDMDGNATYTPSTGYYGLDFFSYRRGNGPERNIYVNVSAQ